MFSKQKEEKRGNWGFFFLTVADLISKCVTEYVIEMKQKMIDHQA